MKPDWKEFLEEKGATFDGDKVTHYGNPDIELRVMGSGSTLTDLSYNGMITAHGADAEDFLHNQFCNDVKKLNTENSQLNGYCSPKGRLFSVFRLFMRENTYYIRLPRDVLENVLKRMRMFVMRSQVTLEDASESLVHIGFAGPNAAAELQDIVKTIPEQVDQTVQHPDFTIVRIPGSQPRFEIMGELHAVKSLWQKLDVHATAVGAPAWKLDSIRAGIPAVFTATSEAFIPQMLNLQAINGLSFKKGCYPGQEIVARMQYLGKLKRHMYRIHINSDDMIAPGDKLFSPSYKGGQDAGTIVDAQLTPDGGYDALAVIQVECVENSDLTLHDNKGPAVEILELPYSLERTD